MATKLAARIRLDAAALELGGLDRVRAALALPAAHRIAGNGFALVASSASALAHGPGRPGFELALAFDGRIDNRHELERELDRTDRDERRSDADLLLAALRKWSDEAFDRIVGPFVAVVVERPGPRLHLARDPLGGRSIFLARAANGVTLASRPAALLGIESAAVAIDPASVSRYLSGSGPLPGSTFFRGIEELPAGAVVAFERGGARVRKIELVPAPLPGRVTDRDYEQRLLDLLDEAVEARLPDNGPTAVLMSGGLDSTAVTASAARLLAARGAAPPRSISWVFDELHACDERRWIGAANRATGAHPQSIVIDDLYPLAEVEKWPRPIDSPMQGPFYWPRQRALALASAADATVLLAGESADDLWTRGDDWLRDLVSSGRLGAAARDLVWLALLEARGAPTAYSLRTSIGRLVRRPRQEGPAPPAPWLTLSAATHLKGAEQQTDDLWRPFRQPGVLTHPHELGLLRFAELEIEPFGTELRRPFRDRRLVEYLLAVPPRLQYRPGRRKFLLRRALRHRLPAEIVRRRHLTSLQPLFDRGLGDRAHAALLATLADPAATWPRYVRREWLRERLRTGPKPESDGVERLVLWSCWCVEIWQQRLRAHLAAEGLVPVSSEASEALTE